MKKEESMLLINPKLENTFELIPSALHNLWRQYTGNISCKNACVLTDV